MSYSYQKHSALRVQNARDRALRQVELAKLLSDLCQAESKWNDRIVLSAENDSDMMLHYEAVSSKISPLGGYREPSPFLLSRLATLSAQRYRASLAEKNISDIHSDYRQTVNWLCEVLQQGMTDEDEKKDNLDRLVLQARIDYEKARLDRMEELKSGLVARNLELKKIVEQKRNGIHLRMTAIESQRTVPHGSTNKDISSSEPNIGPDEWVEVSDNEEDDTGLVIL